MTPKQKILFGIAAVLVAIIVAIFIWSIAGAIHLNSKPHREPTDDEERKKYTYAMMGALVGLIVPALIGFMAFK